MLEKDGEFIGLYAIRPGEHEGQRGFFIFQLDTTEHVSCTFWIRHGKWERIAETPGGLIG